MSTNTIYNIHMSKITFGDWLRITRATHQESLRKLEVRCGVSDTEISFIEHNKVQPSILNAEVIANAYNLKLWEVFRIIDER